MLRENKVLKFINFRSGFHRPVHGLRTVRSGPLGAGWLIYAITFFVFSFGSSLLIFIIVLIPTKITVVTWLKLKLVKNRKISVKYGKKSKRGQTRSVISVRFHLISVNFGSEIKTYNTRSSFQIQIAR